MALAACDDVLGWTLLACVAAVARVGRLGQNSLPFANSRLLQSGGGIELLYTFLLVIAHAFVVW